MSSLAAIPTLIWLSIALLVALTIYSVVLHATNSFKVGDKIQQVAEEKWHNHPILEILDVDKKSYLVKVYGLKRAKPFELSKSKVDRKFVKVKTWSDVH